MRQSRFIALGVEEAPKWKENQWQGRLLVDRRNAAQYLSVSQRSLDYLLANGELNVRRIGSRVLIPIAELQRYARLDHKSLAG